MRCSLPLTCFWVIALVMGLSSLPNQAQAVSGSDDRVEGVESLAAHRIALANARDRIDVLQLELASARREMRRTARVMDALGIDPSLSALDVVGELLAQASDGSDAHGGRVAMPGLSALPLGDQVNRLALWNQRLRIQITQRDRQIESLFRRQRTQANQRTRDDRAAHQERENRPAPGSSVLHEEDTPPAPRWEYTWQKQRLYTGQTTSHTYRTREDGKRVEHVEESPAYDHERIRLHGTFLNRSEAAYCYTFKVLVYGPVNCGNNRVLGYEWVQTPLLEPGELFCWEVEIGVDDVDAIRDADCVSVEAALGD